MRLMNGKFNPKGRLQETVLLYRWLVTAELHAAAKQALWDRGFKRESVHFSFQKIGGDWVLVGMICL